MDISSIYLRAQDIRNWAEQRNLIVGSNPADQYLRLMEGCGQLQCQWARLRISRSQ